MQQRELPAGWDKELTSYPADPKGKAGRNASAEVLNKIAPYVPWLIGGSADLTPSTKTRMTFEQNGKKEAAGDFLADNYAGRNLHFGIREHAMGAVLNGLALSKVRAYGSGFLIFSHCSTVLIPTTDVINSNIGTLNIQPICLPLSSSHPAKMPVRINEYARISLNNSFLLITVRWKARI